jgi:hypothetical protein
MIHSPVFKPRWSYVGAFQAISRMVRVDSHKLIPSQRQKIYSFNLSYVFREYPCPRKQMLLTDFYIDIRNKLMVISGKDHIKVSKIFIQSLEQIRKLQEQLQLNSVQEPWCDLYRALIYLKPRLTFIYLNKILKIESLTSDVRKFSTVTVTSDKILVGRAAMKRSQLRDEEWNFTIKI